jgi:hypothetical protein
MRLLPGRLTRVTRRLVRAPLFTSVAVLTLALGIGANTAMFSVIRGVLLKPLPFDHPDELAGVWHTATGIGLPKVNQGPAFYFTYREQGRSFEDSGMWDTTAVSVTGTGEPERVTALVVTDGTLGVLRVQPALGRRFTAEDDSPKAPPRVMLAHTYWQRKFGSDPSVVGLQVTVDGRPREIIGVLPAGFAFLDTNPQLVLAFGLNRAEVFAGNFSYLGRHCLHCVAADQGDRYPHRARRRHARRHAPVPPPGIAAGLRRHRDRDGGRGCRHAGDVDAAVRCGRARSAHLRGGCAGTGVDGTRGVLRAGRARGAGGPGRGAEAGGLRQVQGFMGS